MKYPKKNILYVVHDYNSFIKDQIEILSEKFNTVFVLVRYNPIVGINKILKIKLLDKYQLNKHINRDNLPKNIKIFPTPILYLPIDIFYKILGYFHFLSADRVIQKNNIKFDLIHCHFIHSAGYVGNILKNKYKKPLIITAHGYDIYDLPFKDKTWRKKTIDICNNADYLITVSDNNFRCIKKLGITTPTSILPNGFSPKLFYPKNQKHCKEKLNISHNKKIILSIGNLVSVKGHKVLIDAIAILRKIKNYNFICYIIGEGVLRKKLQTQINSLGLNRYIKLVGVIPHHKIVEWINASDIFVLPSLNEGNPTVMFECLACGKPFIGTDVGGVKKIIKSEDYGFVIQKDNPKILGNTIIKSLDKKYNNEKIYSYSKIFDWNIICKQIFRIYQLQNMNKKNTIINYHNTKICKTSLSNTKIPKYKN